MSATRLILSSGRRVLVNNRQASAACAPDCCGNDEVVLGVLCEGEPPEPTEYLVLLADVLSSGGGLPVIAKMPDGKCYTFDPAITTTSAASTTLGQTFNTCEECSADIAAFCCEGGDDHCTFIVGQGLTINAVVQVQMTVTRRCEFPGGTFVDHEITVNESIPLTLTSEACGLNTGLQSQAFPLSGTVTCTGGTPGTPFFTITGQAGYDAINRLWIFQIRGVVGTWFGTVAEILISGTSLDDGVGGFPFGGGDLFVGSLRDTCDWDGTPAPCSSFSVTQTGQCGENLVVTGSANLAWQETNGLDAATASMSVIGGFAVTGAVPCPGGLAPLSATTSEQRYEQIVGQPLAVSSQLAALLDRAQRRPAFRRRLPGGALGVSRGTSTGCAACGDDGGL